MSWTLITLPRTELSGCYHNKNGYSSCSTVFLEYDPNIEKPPKLFLLYNCQVTYCITHYNGDSRIWIFEKVNAWWKKRIVQIFQGLGLTVVCDTGEGSSLDKNNSPALGEWEQARYDWVWAFTVILCGWNGTCAHYVMVSKFQWKPFWLATQLHPQITGQWVANLCELWRIRTGPILILEASACSKGHIEGLSCATSAPKFSISAKVFYTPRLLENVYDVSSFLWRIRHSSKQTPSRFLKKNEEVLF